MQKGNCVVIKSKEMISHSLEALNVSNFVGIFAHFLSVHMFTASVSVEEVGVGGKLIRKS